MPPFFQVVGDNVDVCQKPTHETMDRRDKSLHWFQSCAFKERVTGIHLSNTPPTKDLVTLPLSTWLPSVGDCLKLREEFATLVERVLVQNLSEFSFLESLVSKHISHKYSSCMAKKSEIVSIAIQYYYNTYNTYYSIILFPGATRSSSKS